jgi:hypothetical protein
MKVLVTASAGHLGEALILSLPIGSTWIWHPITCTRPTPAAAGRTGSSFPFGEPIPEIRMNSLQMG